MSWVIGGGEVTAIETLVYQEKKTSLHSMLVPVEGCGWVLCQGSQGERGSIMNELGAWLEKCAKAGLMDPPDVGEGRWTGWLGMHIEGRAMYNCLNDY